MKSILNALQDVGFILDETSHELGFVTASKAGQAHTKPGSEMKQDDSATLNPEAIPMRVMASVTDQQNGSYVVRCVIQINRSPVMDMRVYQQFFDAMEYSLFVEQNLKVAEVKANQDTPPEKEQKPSKKKAHNKSKNQARR